MAMLEIPSLFKMSSNTEEVLIIGSSLRLMMEQNPIGKKEQKTEQNVRAIYGVPNNHPSNEKNEKRNGRQKNALIKTNSRSYIRNI